MQKEGWDGVVTDWCENLKLRREKGVICIRKEITFGISI
jgi:hypothetical protein